MQRNIGRRSRRPVHILAVLLLAVSACTGVAQSSDGSAAQGVTVPVDPTAQQFVVNIVLRDTGFDPSTVFLPAGRPIRLVLRNGGTGEHHYRIVGLSPISMSWLRVPDVDPSYVDAMTPEELEALGLGGTITDLEHELHHLNPVFVPAKQESRLGIKPLPNEVHGYVERGVTDTMVFYATTTGTYVVEDVAHPEITGRVIVFDPEE
jgi:hypothetical protein